MTISKQVKKNMEELDNMLFQDEEGGVEHFDIESVDEALAWLKQSHLSLIETMIKCQKQEEQRLQMIKLKSYLGLSDKDIGIKMGELRQCRRTLDYLKTERSKIK